MIPWTSNMAEKYYQKYSYTINISPKKYIKMDKIGIAQWGDLVQKTQRDFLTELVQECSPPSKDRKNHRWETELTKAGHVHIHGYIETDPIEMKYFQELVHLRVGMPKLNPNIVMRYEATLYDNGKWFKYMSKEKVSNEVVDFLMDLPIE